MRLPVPYYQDDFCTIYNADCRDILPLLEPVDLVLTDPPYGMNYLSNHRQIKHEKILNDRDLPLDLILMSIEKALNAAYVFCRWDNLKDMPQPKSVLAWVKNNWSMGDLEHEHGRQWEACCFYPKENHKFIKRIPDVITTNRTLNSYHPTEKPQKLLNTLINCNVCSSILDPFMGSGTALVAAKELGKRAIGIELSKKYCDTAVKRLRQESFNFGGIANET